MFLSATEFPDGHVERAQVCVIGSGPAGMTIAHSLAENGKNVLLLEAGGRDWDPDSQELYAGKVVGDPYFDLRDARLRMLGGTSGHWGGQCRPLDAHDFAIGAITPGADWPIGREALDPWLGPACELLEIPAEFPETELAPDLRRVTFHFSPPVRFGDKYYDYCERSQNLRVFLNSALVGLTPDEGPDGPRIRSAEIVSGQTGGEATRRWSVEAETFVLCLGGIENSRLLLWANEQAGGSLVPNPDLIGRYWMEHFDGLVAEAVVSRNLVNQTGAEMESPAWRSQGSELYFAMSEEFQRREGVLNATFLFLEQAYAGTKQLVADIMCVAPPIGRRLMGLLERDLVCGARVQAMWEQAPDYDNRVALGTTTDPLGLPEVELHWRATETDRRTIETLTLGLAGRFAEADLGRMRPNDWIVRPERPMMLGSTPAHYHHMGGTRMSASPADGVVDSDLKVHGLGNLYVGGSSVFPSGGYVNPTLTIVQLALRLADHLAVKG
ncbi:GMC oxidoreductase [Halovulum sp. GXIMD14794]